MSDGLVFILLCYLAGFLATVSTLASADRDEHLSGLTLVLYALLSLAWPLVWLVSFVSFWSYPHPNRARLLRWARTLVVWGRRLLSRRRFQ